jgi:hypothetical protein
MSSTTAELKSRIKQLRDQLAAADPLARMTAHVPAELRERLHAAAEQVGRVYLLVSAPAGVPPETLEEVCDDALVEGHLVLHDWQRCVEQQRRAPGRPRTPTPLDRRQHTRQETQVQVQLLRHSVADDGGTGVALASQEVIRPARNVSMGGLFVTLPRHELPEVKVGSVLRVAVSGAPAPTGTFQTRAAVARRDDIGVGLRWLEQSDRFRRAIEQLLDTLRRVHAEL